MEPFHSVDNCMEFERKWISLDWKDVLVIVTHWHWLHKRPVLRERQRQLITAWQLIKSPLTWNISLALFYALILFLHLWKVSWIVIMKSSGDSRSAKGWKERRLAFVWKQLALETAHILCSWDSQSETLLGSFTVVDKLNWLCSIISWSLSHHLWSIVNRQATLNEDTNVFVVVYVADRWYICPFA